MSTNTNSYSKNTANSALSVSKHNLAHRYMYIHVVPHDVNVHVVPHDVNVHVHTCSTT